MANRPKGFGFSAEVKNKIRANYDMGVEKDAVEWIESLLGEGTLKGAVGPDEVHKVLKDGSILCRVINTLQPNSVKKIYSGTIAMKLMENTGLYLSQCEVYGVKKSDLFQTADLYDNQNMGAVMNGIVALGRRAQAQGFEGKTLGPKEAVAEKREFTDEQLKEGKNIIGLQMGTNKGASQAGMTMGKTRAIID